MSIHRLRQGGLWGHMKHEWVETFLAVAEYGTIANAALHLHITQATASIRIQQLEEELGVELFYRKKGQKETELSPYGKLFFSTAQLWNALWKEAMDLKNRAVIQDIRVAAPETINTSTFYEIYQEMVERFPNINLTVKSYHSREVHRLVESQLCDVGFCSNLYYYADINSMPFYEEKMVLLCHRDHPFHRTENIRDLSYGLEVYVSYSNMFDALHEKMFEKSSHRVFVVGTTLMQTMYLKNEKTWAIIPYNMAHIFQRDHPDFAIHQMEQLPKRTIYLLTCKRPKPEAQINISVFLQNAAKHLRRNETITLLNEDFFLRNG